MRDRDKTPEQLISELKGMRQRVRQLEASETKRERAEKTLRDTETRFKELADSLPEAIFEMDKNGKLTFANRITVQTFGYGEEDLEKKLEIADLVAPQDRGRVAKELSKLLAGKGLGSQEYTAQRKDGTKFPVLIHAGRIIRERKVLGLRGVFIDMTERKQVDEELQATLAKLRHAMGGVIQAMTMAVEMRDPYTAGHQRRVTNLARAISSEMDLSIDGIDAIRMAGVVHDIGKIHVPAEILSKPGQLTESEFGIIKSHPQVGYDILSTIDFEWPVADIVIQHHERINGSGYPAGLKQNDIMTEAKILGVADTFEAMASHRPYRPALGIDKASEELSENKGILYDSRVVDACLKLIKKKGFQVV